MPPDIRFAAMPAAVFLLMLPGLVHVCRPVDAVLAQELRRGAAPPVSRGAKVAGDIRRGTEALPTPVLEMREAILAAVRSGRIEDLRTAVELNELKPAIAEAAVGDPIEHWRRVSADGEGREILAVLGKILNAGYVVLPIGRDLENNRIYVWPYFAETGVGGLTPEQRAELERIVPVEAAEEMTKAGRYTFYKLGIGADGTWHFFLR